jgi:hypothetical protein
MRKRKISLIASPSACTSASSSSQSKQQKQQQGTSNDTTNGETGATIKEHVTTMKKKMGKVSNKNLTGNYIQVSRESWALCSFKIYISCISQPLVKGS